MAELNLDELNTGRVNQQPAPYVQVMRRIGEAGMVLGGFAAVIGYPAQAAAAQVWESPQQQAVPVGPPIEINSQTAANGSLYILDHKPHLPPIETDKITYGPIQVLISPPKTIPLPGQAASESSKSTETETTLAVAQHIPGQLSLDLKASGSKLKPASELAKNNPLLKAQPAMPAADPNPNTTTISAQIDRRPASQQHISAEGIQFVAGFEGWSSTLYNDATGNATIGYGHLVHAGPVNGSEPAEFKQGISQDRGRQILGNDLADAEKAVDETVKVPLSQNEEDVLDSLAFNIGRGAFDSSTLAKDLNNGRYDEVSSEILRWDKGDGGNSIQGLTNRRLAESNKWEASQQAVTSPVIDLSTRVELAVPPSQNQVPKIVPNLISPKTYTSLLAAPRWQDGGPANKTETTQPKPFMQNPFKGPAVITSGFGERESPTAGASTCHLGVDFALDYNDPILAPRDGTIVANAFLPANGNTLGIMHDGIVSWYFHLNDLSSLPVGTKVITGQTVGRAGSTGISDGSHLHFGVQVGVDPTRDVSLQDGVNGHYVDPTGLLNGSIQNSSQFNSLSTATVCN